MIAFVVDYKNVIGPGRIFWGVFISVSKVCSFACGMVDLAQNNNSNEHKRFSSWNWALLCCFLKLVYFSNDQNNVLWLSYFHLVLMCLTLVTTGCDNLDVLMLSCEIHGIDTVFFQYVQTYAHEILRWQPAYDCPQFFKIALLRI